MSTPEKFRAAIESGDLDAALPLFADDIRLFSPVSFAPIAGIVAVRELFAVLLRTFENFRYVGQAAGHGEEGDGGPETETHLLHFRTDVEGRQVEGVDILQLNDRGLISTFTVLVRPLSAVLALGDAVKRGLIADGVLPSATS
jgi:hypothetical protein